MQETVMSKLTGIGMYHVCGLSTADPHPRLRIGVVWTSVESRRGQIQGVQTMPSGNGLAYETVLGQPHNHCGLLTLE